MAVGITVGLCMCGMCVCWCLRNLGAYEEEFIDEETGAVKVVRRHSVVQGMQRVRRMSMAPSAGRTGSVIGRASSAGTGAGENRRGSIIQRTGSMISVMFSRARHGSEAKSAGEASGGEGGGGVMAGLRRSMSAGKKRPANLPAVAVPVGRTESDLPVPTFSPGTGDQAAAGRVFAA